MKNQIARYTSPGDATLTVFAKTGKKALSVTRQVELAREFASSKGWQVSEDHIYVDHGFSGAEFEKRPGLQRLLAAAQSSRPPFSMLVVSERKSIGRETDETGFTIKHWRTRTSRSGPTPADA